jgi:hypothetical protein
MNAERAPAWPSISAATACRSIQQARTACLRSPARRAPASPTQSTPQSPRACARAHARTRATARPHSVVNATKAGATFARTTRSPASGNALPPASSPREDRNRAGAALPRAGPRPLARASLAFATPDARARTSTFEAAVVPGHGLLTRSVRTRAGTFDVFCFRFLSITSIMCTSGGDAWAASHHVTFGGKP